MKTPGAPCTFGHNHDYTFAGKGEGTRPGGYWARWYALMICRFCLDKQRVYYDDLS